MTAGRSSRRRERGAVGLPRVHHRVTDSTNERAKELGARGAPHGTLVTADEQTAGRGRHGRRWLAPPGRALLASVVVRPLDEADALLPLAAAVAVCEACERTAAVTCAIKWPNDVWIDRRKVAGILIEGRPQEGWAVVGAGVNVTTRADDLPEDLRDRATSLTMAAGGPVTRDRRPGGPPPAGRDAPSTQEERAVGEPSPEALLPLLMRALEQRLDDDPADVLAAWRARDALAGRHVEWDGGRGVAAGVDEAGALLVDTATGRAALDSGEVQLRVGA